MEIAQLFEIDDFTPKFNIGYKLGRNPSAEKLKSMFNTIYGSNVPAKNIKFLVEDSDGRVFIMFYNKNENEVYFENLTVRKMD